MDDQELARRLQNAANAVSLDAPSLGSVAQPQPPSSGSRWAAAGIAALALVGVAGVVVTRDRGGAQVATAPAITTVPTTPVPTPSSVVDDSSAAAVGGSEPDDGTAGVETTDPNSAAAAAGAGGLEGGDMVGDDTPEGYVIERTFGEITLRFVDGVPTYSGYLDAIQPSPSDGPSDPGPGVFFEPAPVTLPQDCNYVIEGSMSVLGDGNDDSEPVPMFAIPGPGSEPWYSWEILDLQGQQPYLAVVVRNGNERVSATLTAFGSTDTTNLVDGYAILLVPANTADGENPIDALLLSDSATIEVTVASADGSMTAAADSSQATSKRCEPRPMPAPGAQPADPDAAYQSVEDALRRLTDLGVSADQKRDLLNDWTGVDQAMGAVANAVGGEGWQWTIKQYVFTSPTQIWFYYYIPAQPPAYPTAGYGVADLVDGEWQFNRAMVCEAVLAQGAECAGDYSGIGPAL